MTVFVRADGVGTWSPDGTGSLFEDACSIKLGLSSSGASATHS